MFKQLWEKKQQIDYLIKVRKAIKDLNIHSTDWMNCECYIDSNFHIYDFKVLEYRPEIFNSSVEYVINKAIERMQFEIQQRTNEIMNWNN